MTEQVESSVESRLAAVLGATNVPNTPKPEVASTPAPEESEASETEVEDDGNDDLDVEGEVYRVPKPLKAKAQEWKDGYLRREDYTRKTQDLADLRKQAQAAAEALHLRQSFENEVQEEREEVARLKSELGRYKQVDWPNLSMEDYIKLKGQQDSLKERMTELNGSIEKKSQALSEKMTAHKRSLIEEAGKYLQRSIPNWNEEAMKSARSGAQDVGYTEDEMGNVYDARFVHLAWKAAQYDKLQSGKAQALAGAQKAPPVIKPGATKQTGADSKYKDARDNLRKNPNDLGAATNVFLQRERMRNGSNR